MKMIKTLMLIMIASTSAACSGEAPVDKSTLRVPTVQAKAMTDFDASDDAKIDKALDMVVSTLFLRDGGELKRKELRELFVSLKTRFPDLYQEVVAVSVIKEPGGHKAHMRVAVKSALGRGPVDPSFYRANVYVYEDEIVLTPEGWKSLANPQPIEYYWLDLYDEPSVRKHLKDSGMDLI